MKNKAQSKTVKNYLDSVLKIRFNTSMVPPKSLSTVIDFPKLKKKQLIMNLLWGTFQIRLSKSYLSDLLKNHILFEISKRNTEKLNNSRLNDPKTKIIGVEISSRHKRVLKAQTVTSDKLPTFRTKYKVLIQYIPNVNQVKSIKSNLIFLLLISNSESYLYCFF